MVKEGRFWGRCHLLLVTSVTLLNTSVFQFSPWYNANALGIYPLVA